MTEGRTRIVSICGSLRAGSINGAVLAAAASASGPDVEMTPFHGLAELPHFNPDHDHDAPPPAVQEMRDKLARAGAILFSTPEYAGSLPGSFKNLLDWTIGASSLYRRPVGWINPSAHGGAGDAFHALRLVLDKAGANVVEAACANIPVGRNDLDAEGRIQDEALLRKIAAVTSALAVAARESH